MILKTIGLGDVLKSAFRDADNIEAAFIYGSYAKNTENVDSDIDLFVIGNISMRDLQAVISDIEDKFQSLVPPPENSYKKKFFYNE